MTTVTLNINGEVRKLKIDGSTPLLWVLRDELKLTGTKYGCGRGLCGACTVHINGEATRSCVTSVESVNEEKIKTIEGLQTKNDLNAVQKAWIAEGVPQCGYCQSGQIMAATALLSQRPDPNDQDIDNAMKNNICRCGTYTRIRKAIHRAAKDLNSG